MENKGTKELNENTEKSYSKIQWFFFVIVIPLLFAITLSLVILSIAGFNVFDLAKEYGQNVPVVSNFVETDEESNSETENMFTLKATIEDQKATIADLQAEIDKKQSESESLNKKIEELTKEIEALKAKERDVTLKYDELAKLYETMSTKKAAAILSELDNAEIIDIFMSMKNDTRAAILEKMEPLKAAEITKLLKPDEEVNPEKPGEANETTNEG